MEDTYERYRAADDVMPYELGRLRRWEDEDRLKWLLNDDNDSLRNLVLEELECNLTRLKQRYGDLSDYEERTRKLQHTIRSHMRREENKQIKEENVLMKNRLKYITKSYSGFGKFVEGESSSELNIIEEQRHEVRSVIAEYKDKIQDFKDTFFNPDARAVLTLSYVEECMIEIKQLHERAQDVLNKCKVPEREFKMQIENMGGLRVYMENRRGTKVYPDNDATMVKRV